MNLAQPLSKLFPFAKGARMKQMLFAIIMRVDDNILSTSREIMKRYYNISIGKYSYGCFKIDASVDSGTIVGAFCSIAPGVRIGGMNHPTHFVSTHPFLYTKRKGFAEEDIQGIIQKGTRPVIIEDDVWIGQNAVILAGVKISKGAVIGSGAIVTKDIPPYSIAVGVPAKVIRKRFSDEQIDKLSNIDWANWNDETIKQHLALFYDVDMFLGDVNKLS